MPAEVTDSTKQAQAPEQHLAQQTMAAENQQGPSAAHVSDLSKSSTTDLVNQKVLPDTKIVNGDAQAAGDKQPLPPDSRGTDVLSEKDSTAVHDAKTSGKAIDESTYQNQPKTGGLGEFQAQDGKADQAAGRDNAVDGSQLNLRAGETDNKSGRTKGADSTPDRAGERGDHQTITKTAEDTASKPADATRTPADATRTPADTATKPADQTTAPALQKSDRLNEKPNGSGEVTVKPHDNLWRIASESLKQNHPEGYKPSNQDIQKAVTSIAKENHLSNPNLIRDGQKIKIPEGMIKHAPDGAKPQDTITKPQDTTPRAQDTTPRAQDRTTTPQDTTTKPQEVTKPQEAAKPADATAAPEVGFENHNASPEFAAQVQGAFKNLPENVQKLLANNGTKLVVGGKMSEANPELKGVTPSGWSKNKTWDDDDGEFDVKKKEIIIAEKSHNSDTGGWDTNDRMPGGLNHETGHAVDAAMGKVSHSDEFKKAYDADVAKMSPADQNELKYLLQNGQTGHEETFAEVFAANNGSSANADQTAMIKRDFPSVSALIARKQAALPN